MKRQAGSAIRLLCIACLFLVWTGCIRTAPQRGVDLASLGQTRHVPANALSPQIVEIRQIPQRDGSAGGYRVEDLQFADVDSVLKRLKQLKRARLREGLLVTITSIVEHEGLKGDMDRLCSFAAARNIDLFVRRPQCLRAYLEDHASWLVQSTNTPYAPADMFCIPLPSTENIETGEKLADMPGAEDVSLVVGHYTHFPITLHIELVTGEDGGPLESGADGWIHMSLTNISREAVVVWRGNELESSSAGVPTWLLGESSDTAHAPALFTFQFLDGDQEVAHAGVLDPPDLPLSLEPREKKELWRSITSPTTAGTYNLKVVLDNYAALEKQAEGTAGEESPAAQPTAVRATATVYEVVVAQAEGVVE